MTISQCITDFISISDYEEIKDVLRKISKDMNVIDKEVWKEAKASDGGIVNFPSSLKFFTRAIQIALKHC